MRNRAKCRLCNEIIESFHRHDYVECKCKQIAVDGGNDYFKCSAIDWKNFIRLEDNGTEIDPEIIDKTDDKSVISPPGPHLEDQSLTESEPVSKLSRKELVGMLEEMAKNIEHLPQQAMTLPINHYDFYSLMLLLISILRED